MPRCARDISPGVRFWPPPIREVRLELWCGARYGRVEITFVQSELREWIFVIAICSSSDGGGNKLALACAKSVLPVPGGPEKRML